MATSAGSSQCIKCGKDEAITKCAGCQQGFCFIHLEEHRQELKKQLNEIEVDQNLFRAKFHDKISQFGEDEDDPLIKKINQWEKNSIKKIQRTARKIKEKFFNDRHEDFNLIENSLKKLTEELNSRRKKDVIVENNLERWKKELAKLTEQLNKPPNATIQRTSTPLIYDIDLDISSQILCFPPISSNTKWKQNGITIAGGNGKGDKSDQLCPEALYVYDDHTIYIADRYNHRIVEWRCGEKNGRVVAGGNRLGKSNKQLDNPTDVLVDKKSDSLIISDWMNRRVMQWPRQNGKNGEIIIPDIECWGLAMDKNGYLYVSDTEKHEVRRWKIGDTNGTIVAGGNGNGNHLNQLNSPSYIFVDEDYSVYVSDSNNYRVMKWMKDAKEGIVVAGGNGDRNNPRQLFSVRGVTVDRLDQIYVADRDNHRVMRWCKGATHGTVVLGGNREGAQSNLFNRPIGLSFDRQGNLYVADSRNYRIQKFEIDLNDNC